MIIKNIQLLGGMIHYNDFDIDQDIPFEEQWYAYKEDILQVLYGSHFILDVGWYAEHNPNGFFLVRAILDNNWEKPISAIKCKTLKELKIAIEETACVINDGISQQVK